MKWEYMLHLLDFQWHTKLLDLLDKLGQEGWELCGLDPNDQTTGIFKRIIQPPDQGVTIGNTTVGPGGAMTYRNAAEVVIDLLPIK